MNSNLDFIIVRADEFCYTVTDGTHDSPKRKETGKHLVTSKHIKGRSINFSDAYLISEEDFNKINLRSKVDQWDVLISMIGAYCGFCYVEREKEVDYAVKNVGILKVGDKVKAEWLFYYLNSPQGKNYLETIKAGSTQPYISLGELRKMPIKVPKKRNELEQIVKVLGNIDEKIEINNKINKKLEEMAQAIFKQWFVDFEFPNEDGKPYKSSGGEMVESELGMIPNGWEVIEFMDIMNISSGKRPTKKNNEKTSEFTIPLAGASSIMGYVKEYNYDEPILVIGRVGTHGVVQRFNGKVWASDNTLVITSTYHEFTYQILNRIDYSALNRGSTQPLITQTDIKKQKIVKAKCELLNEYEKITGDIFNTINNNNKEIDKLVLLRDTLLPKLMSGEIRVPVEN